MQARIIIHTKHTDPVLMDWSEIRKELLPGLRNDIRKYVDGSYTLWSGSAQKAISVHVATCEFFIPYSSISHIELQVQGE